MHFTTACLGSTLQRRLGRKVLIAFQSSSTLYVRHCRSIACVQNACVGLLRILQTGSLSPSRKMERMALFIYVCFATKLRLKQRTSRIWQNRGYAHLQRSSSETNPTPNGTNRRSNRRSHRGKQWISDEAIRILIHLTIDGELNKIGKVYKVHLNENS